MGLSPKQLRQLTQNMHVQDRSNQLYQIPQQPKQLRVPTDIAGRHSTIPNLPQIAKQLTSPKKYRVANPRHPSHFDPQARQNTEAGAEVSVNTASLENIKSPNARGYEQDLSPHGFRSPAAQIRAGAQIMAGDMSP